MPLARWLAWLYLGSACLWAKEIYNHRWNYSVNLPSGWLPESGEDGDSLQRFRSLDNRLIIEVRAWEKREAKSLNAMYIKHLRQLNGSGVAQPYRHMGYTALLARIEYYEPAMPQRTQPEDPDAHHIRLRIRGKRKTARTNQANNSPNAAAYVLYFYGARYAYRVASIGARNAAPLERDIQHSVLDSFGFSGHNFWRWGAVSSFLIQQQSASSTARPITWRLATHSFETLQGAREAAEQQVALAVLKREQRILDSAPDYPYALQRFYTLNFRQNFPLLKDFAASLQRAGRAANRERYETLLYDLQDMLDPNQIAAKSRTLLETPGQALTRGTTNIETLALLYAILNAYLQNNTLILYKHHSRLLVGVAKPDMTPNLQEGIRIHLYQNQYLMGELDQKVYIGWVRITEDQVNDLIPLTFPAYRTPKFFP